MEEYRSIMLNGAHLIALWAVAYISAPMTPNSILEYIMLGGASAWLMYAMYLMQKEKRRPSSLFLCFTAVVPWAFYGELIYIYHNNEVIDPQVFENNLQHAFFVYQSFKYLFMGCAVIAVLKGLVQDIRNFGSTR